MRLKHVATTGPGAGSKAADDNLLALFSLNRRTTSCHVLFRRVRASLSQKLIVPSEPGRVACQIQIAGYEGAHLVLTTGRERAVYGVEGDVVHGVDERLVFRGWRLIATVAFEREVVTARALHQNLPKWRLQAKHLRGVLLFHISKSQKHHSAPES